MRNRSARQGYLEIEGDKPIITIDDEHFGRLCRVKNRSGVVHLFSSPPEGVSVRDLSKAKRTPLGAAPYPAAMTFPNGQTLMTFAELPIDQDFLARHLPGYPNILEVVTFDRVIDKDDEMPETGDGITITLKGYVFKDQVNLRDNEKFKKVKGDIFPNRDLIRDIYQNTFGDCFLLASVLSILHQPNGSDFIRGMMRQEGDYTIVRLYHPETLEPHYIRVKNSDYHQQGRNLVLHQAPWVHILEKAYTAFGFKKNREQSYMTFPAFREMYGNGGNPEFALTILTGQPGGEVKLQEQSEYPWKKSAYMDCLPIYFSLMTIISALENQALDDLDAYLNTNTKEYLNNLYELMLRLLDEPSFDEILKRVGEFEAQHSANGSLLPLLEIINEQAEEENKSGLIKSLGSYIDKFVVLKMNNASALSPALNGVRDFYAIGVGLFRLMQEDKLDAFLAFEQPVHNYDDVAAYFDRIKPFECYLPASALDQVKQYAYEKIRWDLPRGSGRYAQSSLDVFEDIEAKLHDPHRRNTLVATTRTVFAEKNVAGLRNRHAYAIADAYDKKLPGGAVVKMIRLRNPWGHTGREIDWAKARRGEKTYIREDKNSAEFEVELSDFVKYFRKYSVGQFVPPAPILRRQSISTSQRQVVQRQPAKPSTPGFFKRHWGKMLVGGLLVAGLVVAGIFTAGVVPAIAAGVIAGLAAVHITVGVAVATGIGVGAIGLGAAAIGVGLGAASGAISDKCCSVNERSLGSSVYREDTRPLLLPEGSDDEKENSLSFDTSAINEAITSMPPARQKSVGENPAVVGEPDKDEAITHERENPIVSEGVFDALTGKTSSFGY